MNSPSDTPEQVTEVTVTSKVPVDDLPGTGSAATAPQHRWAGRSALIMPVMLIILGAFLLYGAFDMHVVGDDTIFGPRAVPLFAACACFVVAVLMAVSIVRNPELGDGPVDEDGNPAPGTVTNWNTLGVTFGAFVAFAILLEPAGWIISGAIVFWIVTVGFGNTAYVKNLLIGLAGSSIVEIVFGGLLGLNLPAGVFGMF